MDRRGFLGAILASCAAPAIVRAGSLMRGSGIVIPTTAEVIAVGSNTLLTPQIVAREALRILREQLVLMPAALQTELNERATMVVRRPQGFAYG